MIEVTTSALAGHPFLHGMPREHLDVLAHAASDVTFPARHRIFEDGGFAVYFGGFAAGSGIFFGLAPALRTSRADIHETLKEGGRGSSGARHRLQDLFVVVEMAMALVLLVGAALMIRSLANLWGVNPGFNPHNAASFALSYPGTMGATPDAIRASMRQLHDSVASVPGVQAASLSAGSMPMSGDSELPFWVEGQPKPATQSEMKTALFYAVEPDFLNAMGIPLLRGRFLSAADNEHSPLVITIDEQFAKLFFAGKDPIGQHVNFGPQQGGFNCRHRGACQAVGLG